jgi:CheY-like chemotaxis protein
MVSDTPVNILLVDDEAVSLTLMESMLDAPGMCVHRAVSATEALLAAQREDFAVALIDVQMPTMGGFELARKLRDEPATQALPIIFVTGMPAEESFILEGYDAGAVDLLFKPPDPVVLRSKVGVFCELYRKDQQLRDQMQRIEEANALLQRRLDEIRQLRTLLPICSTCKKIRKDDGYWEQVDVYLREHGGTQFSHGICPDCLHDMYPDIADEVTAEVAAKRGTAASTQPVNGH